MFRGQTDGFSLVEVMVVCALIAVLAAITIPTVAAGLERYEILSARQQVVSTIRAARMQAVGRNQTLRVRFDFPSDGQYQVVNTDGDAVGGVQLLPDGILFSEVSADIEFNTSGRAAPVGGGAPPITVVVSNGDADQDRTITVSASGRVELP